MALEVLAFRALAGKRTPFRRPGHGGLWDGGGGLAVGVVEEAEGFAAERRGAAVVVVGEEIVAGGSGNDFHGWGPTPGVLLGLGS